MVIDTALHPPIIDINAVRADFPVLNQNVNGYPLIYFDNAATTQKPWVVTELLSRYYDQINANIHRGIHSLAEKATEAYEATRDTVASFINSPSREQIIFTRGTTEGLNLIAQSFGGMVLKAGDQVLISTLEHHSNIVPWQLICQRTGAELKVIPINDAGEIEIEAFDRLISSGRVKIMSVVWASNALGTINPVKYLVDKARENGVYSVIDGAQAASHLEVDVQVLDCDFLVFSGHKLYGPTGIGVLYGKKELLNLMPPYQGGGEMISTVDFEGSTWNELPYKFEAGTPNIADTIALKAAIDYVIKVGKKAMHEYEHSLLEYATQSCLREVAGFVPVGTASQKIGIMSFRMEGVHPQDAGILLDQRGIAVRTGHHCTQPLMKRLGLPGTIRASFAFYNTYQEIDALVAGLKRVNKLLV